MDDIEVQLPFHKFTMDLFTLNYGKLIILTNKEFIVPFDGNATIILIGGGGAGGHRCHNLNGGGAQVILKTKKYTVQIGKGELEDEALETVFGEYTAQGAEKLDYNNNLNGGSRGTGGGSAGLSDDAGRGGHAGSDGCSSTSVLKGGIGHGVKAV